MKAILTGITGNLGNEVAVDLACRGFEIIPIIRSKSLFNPSMYLGIDSVIGNDLMDDEEVSFSQNVDCIVHCAGVVRFKDAKDANQKMMSKVIGLAKKLQTSLHYVSTAFLHKSEAGATFNNEYEEDKWAAEQMFISSNIPGTVLRPSILTGNSQTGEIRNFSGYYLVVKAFLSAIKDSLAKGANLRFPRLHGHTNMVPTDQAAHAIGDLVQNAQIGMFYVTNPAPPPFSWLLEETLEHFNLKRKVEFLDCSFRDFGDMDLTDEEKRLFQFGKNFNPYWTLNYNFPNSICEDNLVDRDYLKKILNYYRNAQNGISEAKY